jgi:acyl carrier protein
VDPLEQSLLNQLKDKFGGNPQLTDSLMMMGVDSVGMAELTFQIEKDFGIRVDDQILDVDTVEELVAYVRSRQTAST